MGLAGLVAVFGGLAAEGADRGGVAGAWWGGDAVVKSWTTRDGMPSNQVTALAQTADGYLWVGTDGGVARFDGVSFVTYGEEDGISRIPVTKLTALPDGRLWICNEANENFWLEDGKFRREERRIVEVAVGPEGEVYAYDEERIFRVSDGGEAGMEIPSPERTKTIFTDLAVTRGGAIWLLQLDRKTSKVWRWNDGSWEEWKGHEGLGGEKTFEDWGRVAADGGGGLWFGSFSGACIRVDEEGDRVIRVPWEPDRGLHDLMPGRDGSMWATPLSGGIFRFSGDGFEQVPLPGRDGQPVVLAMLEGAGGEVWIGTEDQGLLQMGKAQVRHHRLSGEGSVMVTALWPEAPGNLVVGTSGKGAFRWKDGKVSRYARDAVFDQDYAFVYSLWKSPEGTLWMGTMGGLHEFRDGEWLSGKAFADRFADAGDTVGTIFGNDGEEGGIWVGRYQGGLDLVKGRQVESMGFPLEESIFDIERGPDGTLWVATMEGIIAKLTEDHRWELAGRKMGLPEASLSVLHRDGGGRLWAGTNGNGLYRWGEGRFSKVEIRGPDAPENILQIQEDADGWLWLGTTRGIYGLNVGPLREGKPLTSAPVWLGAEDGMGSEQCTRMKAARDAEGRLYFGTTDGFVSFDPAEVKGAAMLPRPVLEEFRVEEEPAIRLANRAGGVVVPPGERFAIRFTGLSPEMAERTRFRYRVIGLEPGWVALGSRRFVDFSSTPPGKYRFELQAGVRGQWNPQVAALDLRVRPFYWQTWWFKTLVVLMVLAAGYGVMKAAERRRLERLLVEIERKRAVNEERERISRDLHDSLGAGITHAGMLVEGLATPGETKKIASRLNQRLDSLRRELRTALWMTTPSYDRLPRVCDYLASYAHEWLGQAGIRCELNLADSLSDVEIAPEARHHLLQAVKESLNNIVKHAGAGQVWLDIRIHDESLRVVIRDDGRGFDPASVSLKGSYGLRNLTERMKQVGGDAAVETSPAGTTVALVLPLSSAGTARKK